MNDDLLEIAADWADRFDELSVAERETLAQWLASSPEHREAFDTMCSLMGSPELATALLIQEADSPTSATKAMSAETAMQDTAHTLGQASVVPFKPRVQRWSVGVAVAASVFVAVMSFWFLSQPESTAPPLAQAELHWQYHLQTTTAQRDSAQLDDGSVVSLNAQSSLSVQFSPSQRQVRLAQGQAYFDVARDTQRPFVIDTGTAMITVLGTAFDVNRLGDDVIIYVTEGRVQVEADRLLVLTAGQQVRIESGVASAIMTGRDGAPDWQQGWHEATGQSLNDVLTQLGRYVDKPLVLALGTASSQAVSGRYLLDDPENTLRMIATLYDLHIEYRDQAIIVSQ